MCCYRAHIPLVTAHHLGKVDVRLISFPPWKHYGTGILLEPKVFEIIECLYDPHLVDLFATRDN